MLGNIFDIQRFSTHNGPGIRTTVFFKGCPLRCAWCHNPEGIDFASDAGQTYTVDSVMEQILRDNIFYEETGGGVTFSGGECMAQIEFALALSAACKARGISVAIDTGGHVSWDNFARILPNCDLFLYDVKICDADVHKQLTGHGNALILENLEKLSAEEANIWLRFPIIGGVNDNDAHIAGLADVCRKVRHMRVCLLPYHAMARGKHGKPLDGMKEPTETQLAAIKKQLSAHTDAEIFIGG